MPACYAQTQVKKKNAKKTVHAWSMDCFEKNRIPVVGNWPARPENCRMRPPKAPAFSEFATF